MNYTRMITESQKKAEEKFIAVSKCILQMIDSNEIVNFQTVSNNAGVSRTYLYGNPELRQMIEGCRISGMSKKDLQKEVIRLRARVRELEKMLQER